MKAVVFIDVQNDFIDGALRNKNAIKVLPAIVDYARTIVSDDKPEYAIYATMDTHNGKTYSDTLEGKTIPVKHCIELTDGWLIHKDLFGIIDGYATIIRKNTFGSFDLVECMEEDQMKNFYSFSEIILCGFCTSICCLANAVILRTKYPDIKITVKKDLCACISEESHNRALEAMKILNINVE